MSLKQENERAAAAAGEKTVDKLRPFIDLSDL